MHRLFNYGVMRTDIGFSLFRVGYLMPTHKARFVRHFLPDIAKRYLSMPNVAPVTSGLHIFR